MMEHRNVRATSESPLVDGGPTALFVVEALHNDELVHEAPAIVGQTPSASAYAA